jgi:DNA-binding MarR family transcriptional regulator
MTMTDGDAPSPDALADLAWVVQAVARKIRAEDHRDPAIIALSPLERMVMRHIDANPGVGPKQIASDVGLKSSNTSTTLRALEKKGLVTRVAGECDGRCVFVYPTELARENMDRIRAEWASLLAPLLPDAAPVATATAFLVSLDDALCRQHAAA